MRKYDFAWMLPFTMAAVVVAIGFLLLGAAGLVSVSPPVARAEATAADSLSLAVSTDSTLTAAVAIDSVTLAASIPGETLFASNCAQCHAINDVVVGPALRNVHQRRSVAWLVPWVKNSGKVVASGDEYAVKIFNLYQKQQMPSFALSEAEIKSIIAYIEVESARSVVAGAGALAAVR